MVDTIMEGLYRIEVPLPNSPLRELNSFVITGRDRNLVIDTGFNRRVCFEAMEQGLRQLDIDLGRTDFFMTHMHSDHTGLVHRLATKESAVYISGMDARVFDPDADWRPMLNYADINGFPSDELARVIDNHPGFKYSPSSIPKLTAVGDGSMIEVGDFRLRCLATPGHTQGHLCLYDEKRGLLFSGDHILHDITPHIESWSYGTNALKDYLTSLDRVCALPVNLVLTGHRSFLRDLKSRVEELKEHHEQRADEVLQVLGGRVMTAFDIAAGMTWDIDCERWEDFPVPQKWFATGEALAHLRFLESQGRVRRKADDVPVTFRAA